MPKTHKIGDFGCKNLQNLERECVCRKCEHSDAQDWTKEFLLLPLHESRQTSPPPIEV